MHIASQPPRPGFLGNLSRLVDRIMLGSPQTDTAVERVLRLTEAQERAVDDLVAWFKAFRKAKGKGVKAFFLLAGFAGTGKTTLVKAALERIRAEAGAKNIVGIAFTGKAAQVLRQKGGLNAAATLHQGVYRWGANAAGVKGFHVNAEGIAASADLVVLDECYMVNNTNGRDLMSLGVPVLALGDPGQLPPITGEPYFAPYKPDVFLVEPQRQAADSGIIRLATMVRQGRMPTYGDYGPGVSVLPLTKETQPLIYQPTTQPLCGLNRVRWVYSQRIRKQRGFEGPVPMVGERIMWRKNLHDVGLMNGMVGTMAAEAEEADAGLIILPARFDDRDGLVRQAAHPYLFAQHFGGSTEAPELGRGVGAADWAYALSCHAAQGSEWNDVTVVDDSQAFREQRWKWLYTAITRSSSRMTLLLRQ